MRPQIPFYATLLATICFLSQAVPAQSMPVAGGPFSFAAEMVSKVGVKLYKHIREHPHGHHHHDKRGNETDPTTGGAAKLETFFLIDDLSKARDSALRLYSLTHPATGEKPQGNNGARLVKALLDARVSANYLYDIPGVTPAQGPKEGAQTAFIAVIRSDTGTIAGQIDKLIELAAAEGPKAEANPDFLTTLRIADYVDLRLNANLNQLIDDAAAKSRASEPADEPPRKKPSVFRPSVFRPSAFRDPLRDLLAASRGFGRFPKRQVPSAPAPAPAPAPSVNATGASVLNGLAKVEAAVIRAEATAIFARLAFAIAKSRALLNHVGAGIANHTVPANHTAPASLV